MDIPGGFVAPGNIHDDIPKSHDDIPTSDDTPHKSHEDVAGVVVALATLYEETVGGCVEICFGREEIGAGTLSGGSANTFSPIFSTTVTLV